MFRLSERLSTGEKMKSVFAVMAIVGWFAPQVNAASGKFVCKGTDPWNYSNDAAESTQDTLNSLNCDTAKPINITALNGGGGYDAGILICCVQK